MDIVNETEQNLNKIHQIQLEMLKEFHNFCTENKLRYFIIGGTLLGAVRHGGFIPWDDDVDIGMPRKDFIRLQKLWSEKAPKHLQLFYDLTGKSPYYMPKIMNLKTKVYYPYAFKETHVYIDVFPFDGTSPIKLVRNSNVYVLYFLIKLYLWISEEGWLFLKRFRHSTNKVIKKIKRQASFIIFSFIRLLPFRLPERIRKLIETLASKYDYDNSEYVVNYYGMYRKREIVKREWLEPQVLIKFEDMELYAPKDWHSYLTHIYGDYMTPPPPEKRVNHSLEIKEIQS